MNHEQQIALREAHGHTDENAYFAARPEVADSLCRRVFRHGHERGFDAAVQALRDLSWAPKTTLTVDVRIDTTRASEALAALIAEAKRANDTMLREAGVGIVDLKAIREAERLRAELDAHINRGAEMAETIRNHEEYIGKLLAERPQMATLVDRFLSWPLPNTVCTDGYTHVPSSVRRPDWSASGTNLLSGVEAEAMLAHVLEGKYVPRPAAPFPAAADQWLSWSGGDCPLPRRSRVEIQLRNGSKSIENADYLRWAHEGDSGDIVLYRHVSAA